MLALGGVAVSESVGLAQSLQRAFQLNEAPLKRTAAAFAWIAEHVGLDQATIAAWIQQHISEWVGSAGHYTASVAAGLLDTVVSSAFVIVVMFLLLRDGQALVGAIPDLLPFERERSETCSVASKTSCSRACMA